MYFEVKQDMKMGHNDLKIDIITVLINYQCSSGPIGITFGCNVISCRRLADTTAVMTQNVSVEPPLQEQEKMVLKRC